MSARQVWQQFSQLRRKLMDFIRCCAFLGVWVDYGHIRLFLRNIGDFEGMPGNSVEHRGLGLKPHETRRNLRTITLLAVF